jgi:hypothetical protein
LESWRSRHRQTRHNGFDNFRNIQNGGVEFHPAAGTVQGKSLFKDAASFLANLFAGVIRRGCQQGGALVVGTRVA